MSALIFVGMPILLLAIGMPIYLVLLTAATVGVLYLGVGPLYAIHTAVFGSLDSFPLLAVPLFILAGDLMARGGIAQRLIELIMAMVGGIRGSLGIATIGSAATFGAMSGSSVACVAAIGKLTLPSLEKAGYGRNFSVSMITATGVIDVIIPPSIPMIIYGIAAQQSVTQLFLAGIVPGLIIAVALALYVMLHARRLGIPIGEGPRLSIVLPALRRAIWALLAPVVILGGIYGGAFTPTEAAGVACIYAMVVSVHIYRELTWADVWRITIETTALVGQIMILVAAAGAYAWLIATSGFPQQVVSFVQELHLQTWLLLLVINAVLLLVGSVLEPPPAILVLTPLLLPVVTAAGIDPLHFGLIVTVNLAIGMFLPPFGLNLFASHALFKTPLEVLYRGVIPFLFIYLAVLMLLTYVPAVTLLPVQWMK
ncbi:MAG: dicarboxylate transporter subunit DctM [Enterovirga sp.]|nr:dicarboxylate transporter subunit DctM [Enterovirga sp.]